MSLLLRLILATLLVVGGAVPDELRPLQDTWDPWSDEPFDNYLVPDPDLVKIKSLDLSGPGCDSSQSVSATFAPYITGWENDPEHGPVPNTLLNVAYEDMKISKYPGSDPNDMTSSCHLHLEIEHPDGWQFAVVGQNWRGHVQLDEGVDLTLSMVAYFDGMNGENQTTRIDRVIVGGERSLVTGTVFDWSGGVWPEEKIFSSCLPGDKILHVEDGISMDGEDGLSGWVVPMDQLILTHKIWLEWRNCTE